MINKWLLFTILFIASSFSFSQSLPPTNCIFGETIGSDSGGWYKLDLKSPKYVLRGEPASYKVEGPSGLNSDQDDALVNSQFEGSHGVITLDFWSGEGAKNISLNLMGKTFVWASHKTRCSMDEVYVQNRPIINKISFSSTNRSVVLSYEISQFSRAHIENFQPKIYVKWKEDVYGDYGASGEVTLNSLLGTITISNLKIGSGAGLFKLEARVYDGSYSTTLDIGTIRVAGIPKPPCPTCNPL